MRFRPWFGGYREQFPGSCRCKQVARFLASLGMPHAARMHAGLAAANPSLWPASEWRTHIAEEETVLSPLFRAHGFGSVADQMEAEHVQILAELDQYGRIVSAGLIEHHSTMEDDAVLALEQQIKHGR